MTPGIVPGSPIRSQKGGSVLSTAPNATTSSQRVEPSDIGYPQLTGEKPIRVSQEYAIPGENPGYLFNLAPYGHNLGLTLARHGVYLHGVYQLADESIVAGGHKQISNVVGLGYFGTDIDTEKAFGLRGGLIDFTFTGQAGNTLAAGTALGTQAYVPWAFGDELRLDQLSYNQSFYNHALQFTVGRISPTNATPYLSPGFHYMQWLCSFFSSSCGTPNASAFNSAKPTYPIGSWAGVVTIHPAPHWYAKAGIFENQPLQTTSEAHLGWPGRDWRLSESEGAYMPVQTGYVTSAAESPYPTNFHIGGYYDTAHYADKYYNSHYLPSALFHGAPLLNNRAYGIFGALQQTVWRFNRDPRSTRGLSLYLSVDFDLSGREVDQQQYEGGFTVTGAFPRRSADTINGFFSHQIFNGRLKANEDLIAANDHIPYRMKDQSGFELNYGFAVAPGAVIYPYGQYVIRPDQLQLARPDPRDTYAIAVGVRAVVRFDVLFGLPQPG